MNRFLLTLFMAAALTASAGTFEIKDGSFLLDGKPYRIYGGEMHYARIPREYWRHRIQMAHAMGCNTLSIYVFWNYHESAPGVWDWQTDNHDLRAFVQIAKEEGMYIVLRPGPYTCAEWDFGGLPYWFAGTRVRTSDPAYLDSCRTYLKEVYRQVDGLFIEQGGNIIMTQVENEYGSFSFDMQCKVSHRDRRIYMEKLAAIFREVGFTHTLFTCDGGIIPVINFARLGHINGLFPGTNDSKFLGTARHTVRRFYNKKGPYYIPEEYAGWFTHWGDAHVFHRDVEKYKTHIEELLKTDFSFCYYMVHGGTNFGFWNGANHRAQNDVWPVITSYDYGAPIGEAGNRTPLYDSLRAVYARYTGAKLPEVPAPVRSMGIDKIELKCVQSTMRRKPFIYKDAPTMEQSGHPFGYIAYEKTFVETTRGKLSTDGLTDYAQIYVNDSLITIINRDMPAGKIARSIAVDIPLGGRLKIVVENMGRINFGKKLWENHRGVTKGIRIDGKIVNNWVATAVSEDPSAAHMEEVAYQHGEPIYYSGTFALTDADDTYLDMHAFGKGCVFVNGHNLGRYWEIGPQYSLYVPGVWLHKGKNEIVIFDMLNRKQQYYISATDHPVNR
ncbi:MAG: beta-galactosidase [Bacteroidetes bacterium]|nr:beta-galactosidase [Bacteroidota bacterium]